MPSRGPLGSPDIGYQEMESTRRLRDPLPIETNAYNAVCDLLHWGPWEETDPPKTFAGVDDQNVTLAPAPS